MQVRQKEHAVAVPAERTSKRRSVPTTVWIQISTTSCYGVDAGANGHTSWECETTYEWTSVQVGGRGSNNGGNGDEGPPDPVPRIPEDDQNESQQLQDLLKENEYLLLDVPCEEIPKWAALAQHETPEDVINRLEQPDVLSGSSIQKLEDASGALVNMDKFSVTVPGNKIPDNMNAKEYLDHIRTNINDYVDGSTFEFYPGLNGEAEKWEDDPLGTLFSIQLVESAPWLDDGSVVTTNYKSSNWIFTTLYTPEDNWHPVSGNRRFGFTNNGDGTFTFYTRGVDRLSTRVDQWAQSLSAFPFTEADNLWSSFQELIAEDFQNATIHDPVTYRPDYDKVASILNGTADSSILGCN